LGYRGTWIAAKGVNAKRLLPELGWERTGERYKDHCDTGVVLFRRGPWVGVFADGFEFFEELTEEQARTCAPNTETLFCQAGDSSMQSQIRSFRGGEETWSVVKPGGPPVRPTVTGRPPAALDPIMEDMGASQESSEYVDYWFEVAVALGEELLDFRYDRPRSDKRFERLRRP